MKKKIIRISVVILTSIAILYGLYALFLKRTPEKILKAVFDISLKDFDYTVETFEEQWYPNGDGKLLLIINFNKLTQANIDYLENSNIKPLPLSIEEYNEIGIPDIYRHLVKATTGYYLYRPIHKVTLGEEISIEKRTQALSFDIFVIDTDKKTAILYIIEI